MSATETPAADTPSHRYTGALAQGIEARWHDRWEAEGTFGTPNPAGPLADPAAVGGRPKRFILDMFPYPSGAHSARARRARASQPGRRHGGSAAHLSSGLPGTS